MDLSASWFARSALRLQPHSVPASLMPAAGFDIAKSDMAMLEQAVRHSRIDLLVVAAGIQEIDTLGTVTRDIMLRQFEVNALGPVLVVQALLQKLQPGSKVCNQSVQSSFVQSCI